MKQRYTRVLASLLMLVSTINAAFDEHESVESIYMPSRVWQASEFDVLDSLKVVWHFFRSAKRPVKQVRFAQKLESIRSVNVSDSDLEALPIIFNPVDRTRQK
jgi:hypothetical protein